MIWIIESMEAKMVIEPALIIGIGESGKAIIEEVKTAMQRYIHSGAVFPMVEFLNIEFTSEALLSTNDVLNLEINRDRLIEYSKSPEKFNMEDFLEKKDLSNAKPERALWAKLALADNIVVLKKTIESKLKRFLSSDIKNRIIEYNSHCEIENNKLENNFEANITIFIAGTAGDWKFSGSFLTIAAISKELTKDLGSKDDIYDNSKTCLFSMIGTEDAIARKNQYASFKELEYVTKNGYQLEKIVSQLFIRKNEIERNLFSDIIIQESYNIKNISKTICEFVFCDIFNKLKIIRANEGRMKNEKVKSENGVKRERNYSRLTKISDFSEIIRTFNGKRETFKYEYMKFRERYIFDEREMSYIFEELKGQTKSKEIEYTIIEKILALFEYREIVESKENYFNSGTEKHLLHSNKSFINIMEPVGNPFEMGDYGKIHFINLMIYTGIMQLDINGDTKYLDITNGELVYLEDKNGRGRVSIKDFFNQLNKEYEWFEKISSIFTKGYLKLYQINFEKLSNGIQLREKCAKYLAGFMCFKDPEKRELFIPSKLFEYMKEYCASEGAIEYRKTLKLLQLYEADNSKKRDLWEKSQEKMTGVISKGELDKLYGKQEMAMTDLFDVSRLCIEGKPETEETLENISIPEEIQLLKIKKEEIPVFEVEQEKKLEIEPVKESEKVTEVVGKENVESGGIINMERENLKKGQRIKFDGINPNKLTIEWSENGEGNVIFVIPYDKNGKAKESDLLFKNHPVLENGAVEIISGNSKTSEVINFDRVKLDENIEKVIFLLVADKMMNIKGININIDCEKGYSYSVSGEELALQSDCRVIEMIEVYRYSGEFKVRIIVEGVKKGIEEILTGFGVNVE